MASFVEILEEVTSNDVKEPKYRDASTICLSLLCAMRNSGSQAQKKFRFSALESVALPGGFSRVVEQILNVSSNNATELKASSLKLLASQLKSRRRIGFDGRGFIDLSTRLAKMQSNDLKARVGPAISIMMICLPNLIHHIPTSIGEEVVTSLWTACRDDLRLSSSSQSMIEFLIGMKWIFASVNDTAGDGKDSSKKSLSPALQRTL